MCVNQGAGLQSIALQAAPRVIAMASHGDRRGELPLLWNLCATLVGFGYPVAVLDATTVESSDNPGLVQLLDDACWQSDESNDPLPWSVIPAALGLQRLSTQRSGHGLPMAPLGGLFQNFGVLVIYAHADVLTLLLPSSGIEPLLTVSPVKMSSVTAYQALKKMLLNAKLRPTVATITSGVSSKTVMAGDSPIKKLQECAMTFLDYRLDALTVRAMPSQECPSEDMNRLALRLLENAMPLHRHQFVGSH
ncbi:MAG: hypothetical protein ABI606_04525 [Rhodoferax sp.]